MSITFKHSPVVHVLGTEGFAFLALLAYHSSVDPLERGGPVGRAILVTFCTALALGVLVLHLTSGVNRYEVADDGLHVHRLFRTTFHPWHTVKRIDLNDLLHYIVIRGHDRVIAFSSTDFFPRMIDLIRAVHERSGCALPPPLAGILAADLDDDWGDDPDTSHVERQ